MFWSQALAKSRPCGLNYDRPHNTVAAIRGGGQWRALASAWAARCRDSCANTLQTVRKLRGACLYRAADVALVTPLRDGMNLVAKEYLAAQDPEDPGVLVLSQFAGAAKALDRALIVNPHETDAVASALKRALEMPLAERRERHGPMLAHLLENDIRKWAEDYLSMLVDGPPPRSLLSSIRALFGVSSEQALSFLAAIAIAQAQKAGSFEMRAALSLAKLYQATGRGADAHAVLGRALEGFSPTPEFPEIAEALVHRFRNSNHIRQLGRGCMTKCGRRGRD